MHANGGWKCKWQQEFFKQLEKLNYTEVRAQTVAPQQNDA
jgi:hypothetical protein